MDSQNPKTENRKILKQKTAGNRKIFLYEWGKSWMVEVNYGDGIVPSQLVFDNIDDAELRFARASDIETVALGRHVFTIVNSVPPGYMIWNITPYVGYIPLCKLIEENSYAVDAHSLLAIKWDNYDEWKAITDASGAACTPDEAEEFLANEKSYDPYIYEYFSTLVRKALPVFKKIKWEKG